MWSPVPCGCIQAQNQQGLLRELNGEFESFAIARIQKVDRRDHFSNWQGYNTQYEASIDKLVRQHMGSLMQ